MAQVDTVRPASSGGNVGWVATGGTFPAVLADDSDATYMTGNADLENFVAFMDSHTPPADHGRHRSRLRIRWQHFSGTFSPWSRLYSRLKSSPPASPLTTQWHQAPSNAMGIEDATFPYETITDDVLDSAAITPTYFVQRTNNGGGGSSVQRVMEIYMDIDCREIPTFTPDVLDGAGGSAGGGTITDTNVPQFTFDTIDYDGLTARTWSLEVIDTGTMAVVASVSGSGTPPDPISVGALPDGSYEARFVAVSTIRQNTAHTSDTETVTFDVAFIPPNAPELAATPTANPPSIEVCWTDPTSPGESMGDTEWDDPDEVVVELRRTDCAGTQTIYVAQDYEGCYVDRFMSLSGEGLYCGDPGHECEICYEARWWGLVDDVLVTTEWSDPECVAELVNPTPGNDWLRGVVDGDVSICPDRTFGRDRPFGVFQAIGGGIPTVITGDVSGRNYALTFPVTSEAELVAVLEILAQTLNFYQPADAADVWLTAQPDSVTYPKVKGIRTVSVAFVEVEPQPVVDPESFFV